MNRQRWRHLAPGVVGGIALLSLGGGLICWSGRALHATEEDARFAAIAATRARAELDRLQREAPAIRSLHARLQAVLASGLAAPPAREEWAEQVRAIVRDEGLAAAEFQLAPTRKLGSLDPESRYAIHATRMTLNARVTHEGKLLRLLDRLAGPVPGQLHPVRCLVQGPAGHDLSMQCEFDWLSLEPPPDTPKER